MTNKELEQRIIKLEEAVFGKNKKVSKPKIVSSLHEYKFNNGKTYQIDLADENGVLVFRDAVFKVPFDDKEEWRQCSNVYENSTLKKLLEKWWEENAPQILKDNYTVDLLEDYEIFDADQLPEEYRIGKQLTMFKDWHNRIKGLKGERYSTWWWTKTATCGYVHYVIRVRPTGNRCGNTADDSSGVVPCLRPIKQSDQ